MRISDQLRILNRLTGLASAGYYEERPGNRVHYTQESGASFGSAITIQEAIHNEITKLSRHGLHENVAWEAQPNLIRLDLPTS